MSRRFLVLHGWANHRPPAHWEWQLVEALRSAGEQVIYPQLPDADDPSLEAWTEALHAELAQLGTGERIVIAHSLSTILWLHAAPGLTPEEQVDRVLLVAPPSLSSLAAHPEVVEFSALSPDPAGVALAAGSTRLVCSDDDPWCPEGAVNAFGAFGAFSAFSVDVDLLPGAQHINPDAGYGWWPSALEWCRDPSVRLTAR